MRQLTVSYRTLRGASMTKCFTTQSAFETEMMRLFKRRIEATAYMNDDKVGEVTRMSGLDRGKWMWWFEGDALPKEATS